MENRGQRDARARKGYECLQEDRNSLLLRNNSTRVLQDSEIRPEFWAAESAALQGERVVFQDGGRADVSPETFLGNTP